MRTLFKDIKFLIFFFMMQFVGTMAIMVYKMIADPVWLDKWMSLYDMSEADFISTSISLSTDILMPCLILANILILVPLLYRAYISDFKPIRLDYKQREILSLIAFGLILNVILSFIVSNLPDFGSVLSGYDDMMSSVKGGSSVLTVIGVGILGPVCEELVFRFGMIEKTNNPAKAIILSAFWFGLAHFNPVQSTYAFLLGLLFGYIYTRRYRLTDTILLHIVINSSSVIYEYFPHNAKLPMVLITVVASILILSYSLMSKKAKVF